MRPEEPQQAAVTELQEAWNSMFDEVGQRPGLEPLNLLRIRPRQRRYYGLAVPGAAAAAQWCASSGRPIHQSAAFREAQAAECG